MDDNSALIKMVVLLGAIMLLVSALNPAANSAWSTFSTTVETGPNLPTFTMPGTNPSSYVTLLPIANSTPPDPPYNVTGCTMADYYQCLQPGPTAGPIQEVTLRNGFGSGEANVSVLMSTPNANPGLRVMTVQVQVLCNATFVTGSGPNVAWSLSHVGPGIGPTFFPYAVRCDPGPRVMQYWNMTGVDQVTNWTLSSFAGAYMQLTGASTWTNITLVTITLGLSSQAVCAGDLSGVVCNLGNFVIALWIGIIAIGSAIVFGLQLIFGILIFVLQLIAGIIIGLFTAFLYFFALPGAPPIVQGTIDVLFIAFLLVIGFMVLRISTGLFGGAVNKA